MQISALSPRFAPIPARVSLPTASSLLPTSTDLVTLSAPPPQDAAARKKMFRQVAWAGFGIEMVGGALTLAGHGAIGLPVFALGCAAMVYGEVQAKKG
jgi:hypothetical protein